jgi:hypothetical protein
MMKNLSRSQVDVKAFAASKTDRNMVGVSVPVAVLRWLGW